MRVQGARAAYGYVEPVPPLRERQFIRNIYAQLEREGTARANAAEQASRKIWA